MTPFLYSSYFRIFMKLSTFFRFQEKSPPRKKRYLPAMVSSTPKSDGTTVTNDGTQGWIFSTIADDEMVLTFLDTYATSN